MWLLSGRPGGPPWGQPPLPPLPLCPPRAVPWGPLRPAGALPRPRMSRPRPCMRPLSAARLSLLQAGGSSHEQLAVGQTCSSRGRCRCARCSRSANLCGAQARHGLRRSPSVPSHRATANRAHAWTRPHLLHGGAHGGSLRLQLPHRAAAKHVVRQLHLVKALHGPHGLPAGGTQGVLPYGLHWRPLRPLGPLHVACMTVKELRWHVLAAGLHFHNQTGTRSCHCTADEAAADAGTSPCWHPALLQRCPLLLCTVPDAALTVHWSAADRTLGQSAYPVACAVVGPGGAAAAAVAAAAACAARGGAAAAEAGSLQAQLHPHMPSHGLAWNHRRQRAAMQGDRALLPC